MYCGVFCECQFGRSVWVIYYSRVWNFDAKSHTVYIEGGVRRFCPEGGTPSILRVDISVLRGSWSAEHSLRIYDSNADHGGCE